MKALELADMIERYNNGVMSQAIYEDYLKAAAELRRLAEVESDCAQYLKEGEAPAERIKRGLGDANSLLNLYRNVMAERDALKAELERIKALEPVAVRYDCDGYGWQYIDSGSGSDWLTRHKDGEALYALGGARHD